MELLIKVGAVSTDHASYQDGDIIEALSVEQIEATHAGNICHYLKAGLDEVSGLRPVDSLAFKYAELTSEYRYDRVSPRSVVRTNLADMTADPLSHVPNDKGEAIDVPVYLASRLKSASHRIFGKTGREIWFGGTASATDHNAVWAMIEENSYYLREEHQSWRYTANECRGFLPVNCTGWRRNAVAEVSAGTAYGLVSSVHSPKQKMLAKRKFFVPYWDLTKELGINVDDVRNKGKIVDARQAAPMAERNHLDDIHVNKVEAGIKWRR